MEELVKYADDLDAEVRVVLFTREVHFGLIRRSTYPGLAEMLDTSENSDWSEAVYFPISAIATLNFR